MKKNKLDLITVIVFICFFILLVVYKDLCSPIDFYIHDFYQKTRILLSKYNNSFINKLFPVKKYDSEIVLIIIDDKALIDKDTLLYKDRELYAQAIENLGKLNPKAIGIEESFYENLNPIKDKLLEKAIKEIGDKILVKQYQSKNEVLPSPPFPEIIDYSAPIHFTNYIDNSTRLVSLGVEMGRNLVTNEIEDYSFSFQTKLWAKYKDLKTKDLKVKENCLYIKDKPYIKLINKGKYDYFLINYNKPLRSLQTLKFLDLLDNNIPKSEIEGKIVLIGSTNSMVDERFKTPLASYLEYPVIVNALTLSNLLNENWLTPNNPAISIGLTLIILIALLFTFSHVAPSLALIITFGINLFLLLASLICLMQFNYMLEVVQPCIAAIFAFVFLIGKKYYIEFSEKRHIKTAFQHYVTASVVNEILKDPSKLNLHGEERHLTIFFSDIEGFTTLAEGMSPLDVVSLLNEYLTAMTDIIFEYDGLLDKYEGDAIMAVFGAPVDQSDHATRACQCALKHQKVLNELRAKWKSEGKPEIKVRIGINSGIVVVGNMGSTMRFDYTVIGDNVNLASRLEMANKMFGTSILVSEETAKLAEKKVVSRKVAKLKALGKSSFTNIYELLADKDNASSTELTNAYKSKEVYEEADSLIADRKFEEAEKVLGIYLKDHEKDIPAQKLYNKIKGYLIIPPPADWANAVEQDEK